MGDLAPMSEIMKNSLKALGDDFYIKYLRQSLITNWQDIVGKTYAKKVKPLRIEHKKLFVYSGDSTWKSTLFAYKSKIIKQINDYFETDLIDDIIFGRPSERPREDINTTVTPPKQVDIVKAVRSVELSEEEIEEIEKSCECIEDDILRETFLKASISRAKSEKYKKRQGWHECPCCGSLCQPEEKICSRCRNMEYELFEKTVINILKEVPWAVYSEIRNEISKAMPQMIEECTPEKVESLRGMLVQQIAQTLDKRNQNRIKLLVMLFKGVKPEELTDNLIAKTLYELRYDLPAEGRLNIIRNSELGNRN
ncbi:MAG: DUF721 domain-containing protein [Selenomonadaceae bacterium]|nr:DUF721 domain-containing protein [Selenomonadaceae bacterium]